MVGSNQSIDLYSGCEYWRHAETDVLRKIKKNKKARSKKIVRFDLIVIRVSKTGILGSSKPCSNCLKHLMEVRQYGIYIDNVYYSTSNGSIEKSKLINLINEDSKHVTRRFR